MNPITKKRDDVLELLDTVFGWQNRGTLFDSDYSSKGKLTAFVREKHAENRVEAPAENEAPHAEILNSWIVQIERAIRNTTRHFFRSQYPEGYWWAELESNVTITAEYIMLHRLLERSDSAREQSMVKYLLRQQTANGSWELYFGDGGELSTTIEAYFAMKLAGESPESEPMRRARKYILDRGGIEASRVFTKIWLALFSQYDWDKVPSMPVELVLLPSDLYFNIYEFSSWARGTAVPLSIVLAIRPRYPLAGELSIPELYLPKDSAAAPKRFPSFTHKLFYLFDRIAKAFERNPIPSLRNKAVHAAETWILEHQESSGDWGGIQPPMAYSLLALHYLGYEPDHPAIVKGLKAIEDFCLEDERGVRMQSCVSPVWDTALTVLALLESGSSPRHELIDRAGEWLIKNQVLSGGDWQVKADCPPGGWAFEFFNTHYPDVDDSAVVLNALRRLDSDRFPGLDCVIARGMEWCLGMQSSDGGWAAFDKDNMMTILNRIPFADQEAMVDYPTADITGRILEIMGNLKYDRKDPIAQRALQFLHETQEPDGSWWGRWGVNYIYGTWSVLRGLISIGEDPGAPYIQAAAQWLKDHQNADGGWGETCESYKRPELRGQGPSTPSQTAWALMGLLACGEEHSPEVCSGVQYLLRTQLQDGTWEEIHFTGTGFPKHFYIRYHNYRNCFPLMALGQYLQAIKQQS